MSRNPPETAKILRATRAENPVSGEYLALPCRATINFQFSRSHFEEPTRWPKIRKSGENVACNAGKRGLIDKYLIAAWRATIRVSIFTKTVLRQPALKNDELGDELSEIDTRVATCCFYL